MKLWPFIKHHRICLLCSPHEGEHIQNLFHIYSGLCYKIANCFIVCGVQQGKNYMGAPGDFAPEMQKRALENQTRAPENCHRLQCKGLFIVADLDNGM